MIPITRNEVANLLATATHSPATPSHQLRWSLLRRRHQYRSRACHYQRQLAPDHEHE